MLHFVAFEDRWEKTHYTQGQWSDDSVDGEGSGGGRREETLYFLSTLKENPLSSSYTPPPPLICEVRVNELGYVKADQPTIHKKFF